MRDQLDIFDHDPPRMAAENRAAAERALHDVQFTATVRQERHPLNKFEEEGWNNRTPHIGRWQKHGHGGVTIANGSPKGLLFCGRVTTARISSTCLQNSASIQGLLALNEQIGEHQAKVLTNEWRRAPDYCVSCFKAQHERLSKRINDLRINCIALSRHHVVSEDGECPAQIGDIRTNLRERRDRRQIGILRSPANDNHRLSPLGYSWSGRVGRQPLHGANGPSADVYKRQHEMLKAKACSKACCLFLFSTLTLSLKERQEYCKESNASGNPTAESGHSCPIGSAFFHQRKARNHHLSCDHAGIPLETEGNSDMPVDRQEIAHG
ncbi:MAG: hypothetical protein ACN6RE_08390 [Stenotrophomonas sepilia]